MNNYQNVEVAIATIPVEPEITFTDCKNYSKRLANFVNSQLAVKMTECGISPTVFADIWAQPFLINDDNPYKELMNVLEQFSNIAIGGYNAALRLELAQKEIDRLNTQINSLQNYIKKQDNE